MTSYLLTRFGDENPELAAHYGLTTEQIFDRLPANPAIRELPAALAAAHAHYGVDKYASTFSLLVVVRLLI